jgi:hypothetical protein
MATGQQPPLTCPKPELHISEVSYMDSHTGAKEKHLSGKPQQGVQNGQCRG